MTYARDPFDTDEPPCFCGWQGPADQVCTTREFCPACGDPGKPAPEPPADTPEPPEWTVEDDYEVIPPASEKATTGRVILRRAEGSRP